MPTISQLIKRAEYLVDDVIEASIAIDFFNEALSDLSTVGALEKRTIFQMTASENKIDLPSDFVEIMNVYVIDRGSKEKAKMVTDRDLYNMSTQFSYRLFGDEIEIYPKLDRDYEVELEYFGRIPKLPSIEADASLEAVPKFNERFHRALSIYCALQYAENDDNLYKINNLKEAYQSIRSEMYQEYLKKKSRTRSNTVHVEVGWY